MGACLSSILTQKLFMVFRPKGRKLDSATRSEMTLGRVLGLALGNTLTLATTEENEKIAKASKVPVPFPPAIPSSRSMPARAHVHKKPTLGLFVFIVNESGWNKVWYARCDDGHRSCRARGIGMMGGCWCLFGGKRKRFRIFLAALDFEDVGGPTINSIPGTPVNVAPLPSPPLSSAAGIYKGYVPRYPLIPSGTYHPVGGHRQVQHLSSP